MNVGIEEMCNTAVLAKHQVHILQLLSAIHGKYHSNLGAVSNLIFQVYSCDLRLLFWSMPVYNGWML